VQGNALEHDPKANQDDEVEGAGLTRKTLARNTHEYDEAHVIRERQRDLSRGV
jgi:hypothetical protein